MPDSLPGIINFRDAGGLPTQDGRQMVAGRVFRGSGLAVATDDDLAKIQALGIGLIFDLRSLVEATGRPDRLPEGVVYCRQGAVKAMDETPRESLDWDALIAQLASSPEALDESAAFHKQVYAEMIRRPDAFKVLLGELLSNPGRGVYVHCSAGKDRTGLACAIVQHLLGVAPDVIMANYLESANHPMPDFAAARDRARAAGPAVAEVIDLMTGVSRWQLQSAFDQIETSWGGWDGLTQSGLGLTRDDVAQLKADYTTRM